MKIQTCNSKTGFIIENSVEGLLWLKYKFFEQGISPREFRKCQIRDIRDIMDLKETVDSKVMRESEIQNMIARMRY